jgi:hypothetical protein
MVGLLSTLAYVLTLNGPAAPATRASLVEAERARKAALLTPLEPTAIERVLLNIENDYLIERLFDAPRGVFVRFGDFPTGAGISVGPAYRHSDARAVATVWGAVSQKRYWELGGTFAFPHLAHGRASAELAIDRHEFPEEDFYGLGPETKPENRTSYAHRETSLTLTGGVTPVWWMRASGVIEHLQPRVGPGREDDVPPTHIPEGAAMPDYLRAGGRVAIDSTGTPFGPHHGGRYTVAYDRYSDFGQQLSSFVRWEVDLRQYIPVLGSTRTLAVRGQLVSLVPVTGDSVPFYMQPTLGGPDSLRGLRPYRLRDQSLLLLQSEYRWAANAFLSGVIFYEAGTVARRVGQFRLDDMVQDFGAGLRFGFLSTVSLRVEAAFGSGEGAVVIFRFSDAF